MAEAATQTETITVDDDAEIDRELLDSVGKDVTPPVVDEDDDEPAPAETPNEPANPEPAAPEVEGTRAADVPEVAAAAGDQPGEQPPADPVRGGSDDAGALPPSVQPSGPLAVIEPDDVDKRFDAAIAKIDADEMLSEGQKEVYKLQLETQREERNQRRQTEAVTAEDTFRNGEAKRLGVSRQTLDTAWAQACVDSKKLQGDFGATRALFQQRIVAIKATAKPTTAPVDPKAAAKGAPVAPPAAPTPITPKGARVAPPVAVAPPPPKPKSDEEQLVEDVRKESRRVSRE